MDDMVVTNIRVVESELVLPQKVSVRSGRMLWWQLVSYSLLDVNAESGSSVIWWFPFSRGELDLVSEHKCRLSKCLAVESLS